MISLSHLNKFIFFTFLFIILGSSFAFAEEVPVDIWKENENKSEQSDKIEDPKDIINDLKKSLKFIK